MDFLEALDSIRDDDNPSWGKTGITDKDRKAMGSNSRLLVSESQKRADWLWGEHLSHGGDRFALHIWLVPLETWDAMQILNHNEAPMWNGFPIIPTNLDIPLGIALASLDPVNATAARIKGDSRVNDPEAARQKLAAITSAHTPDWR